MKRLSLFIVALFLLFAASGIAISANPAETFKKANDLYRNGNWEEAAKFYETLTAEMPLSAELYYNLGNAYYKMDNIGKARLNYERARYLDPRDNDTRKNIEFIKGLIEYKVEDKRNWYLRKLNEALSWLTFQELLLLCLFSYLLLLSVLFIKLFFRRPLLGRLSIGLIVFFAVTVLCGLFKYNLSPDKKLAIVTAPSTEARYGPSKEDKTVFRLVRGMKLSIAKRSDSWCLIRLLNGESGWVPAGDIEAIVAFERPGFSLDLKV